ncbi:DUF4040 domain-containing protein [Synechococcus elongatus]|uniref:Multicomponent Na+:H+ antiporter subunit B n=1 Tax=Synechococcus elongatus (strain ATCC 33912 / PCC 7942 / FACHB-805) TaxID=1140 RepID=Q31N70_SYNE7|nr:DUF4040 domain-containing protein [Synechococcus elongatus]ABB57499.1 putative multicomponent Na+:H+ antiporter subunit B [Synechococcus elongatus PCC 7942 = FACHB-805]AJD57848.1 hypothetical protein M744_08340 [Synechococcus elongatus UTEX 2973]MBD2588302.1 DUF4040 domain-containing protein [Synechococcus elongatus FACHB-242]MBD2689535.1 DUF4040 domain-containing protein [Synechococcus elongatus FACHB-1061]MBD2708046.1 DUF4040 domain-containing protein [Synechococcus elongatus PCC 7942 = F
MDSYLYFIMALLPLTSILLICQINPYRALVIRGIFGAIATLAYTVLGAADVALTEALVGTLLVVMLYAIAVRSSLVLRLGVLEDEITTLETSPSNHFSQLMDYFRTIFKQYQMKVELVSYSNRENLAKALHEREIHAICLQSGSEALEEENSSPAYQTVTRLQRVYEIMTMQPVSSLTDVIYEELSTKKGLFS